MVKRIAKTSAVAGGVNVLANQVERQRPQSRAMEGNGVLAPDSPKATFGFSNFFAPSPADALDDVEDLGESLLEVSETSQAVFKENENDDKKRQARMTPSGTPLLDDQLDEDTELGESLLQTQEIVATKYRHVPNSLDDSLVGPEGPMGDSLLETDEAKKMAAVGPHDEELDGEELGESLLQTSQIDTKKSRDGGTIELGESLLQVDRVTKKTNDALRDMDLGLGESLLQVNQVNKKDDDDQALQLGESLLQTSEVSTNSKTLSDLFKRSKAASKKSIERDEDDDAVELGESLLQVNQINKKNVDDDEQALQLGESLLQTSQQTDSDHEFKSSSLFEIGQMDGDDAKSAKILAYTEPLGSSFLEVETDQLKSKKKLVEIEPVTVSSDDDDNELGESLLQVEQVDKKKDASLDLDLGESLLEVGQINKKNRDDDTIELGESLLQVNQVDKKSRSEENLDLGESLLQVNQVNKKDRADDTIDLGESLLQVDQVNKKKEHSHEKKIDLGESLLQTQETINTNVATTDGDEDASESFLQTGDRSGNDMAYSMPFESILDSADESESRNLAEIEPLAESLLQVGRSDWYYPWATDKKDPDAEEEQIGESLLQVGQIDSRNKRAEKNLDLGESLLQVNQVNKKTRDDDTIELGESLLQVSDFPDFGNVQPHEQEDDHAPDLMHQPASSILEDWHPESIIDRDDRGEIFGQMQSDLLKNEEASSSSFLEVASSSARSDTPTASSRVLQTFEVPATANRDDHVTAGPGPSSLIQQQEEDVAEWAEEGGASLLETERQFSSAGRGQ